MMDPIRRQRRACLVDLEFVGGSDVGGERCRRAVFLPLINILMLFHAIKGGTYLYLRSWKTT
jgi:hypothetical protein